METTNNRLEIPEVQSVNFVQLVKYKRNICIALVFHLSQQIIRRIVIK